MQHDPHWLLLLYLCGVRMRRHRRGGGEGERDGIGQTHSKVRYKTLINQIYYLIRLMLECHGGFLVFLAPTADLLFWRNSGVIAKLSLNTK